MRQRLASDVQQVDQMVAVLAGSAPNSLNMFPPPASVPSNFISWTKLQMSMWSIQSKHRLFDC